jgi:ubiquinone/menaquinone biosynthesis C-methylase UbiE
LIWVKSQRFVRNKPVTDRQKLYQRIAPFYDVLDFLGETLNQRRVRPQLLEGLSGGILDAGVGTGRNIPFYPANANIVGCDLSNAMLRRARRRRQRLGRRQPLDSPLHLVTANICQSPFPDDSFDAAIATFLFCVLDDEDQLPALRELARICRPGSEIRILDYVLPEDPKRRRAARRIAPLLKLLFGASVERNTEQYVSAAGLRVTERRLVAGDYCRMLVLHHA